LASEARRSITGRRQDLGEVHHLHAADDNHPDVHGHDESPA
jgi:hypothetical protein